MSFNFTKQPFMQDNATFSFRKLFALASIIIFVTDCFVSIIGSGGLTSAQYAIISGVFIFYFGKDVINNVRLISDDNQRSEGQAPKKPGSK
jgi:hypothetical protein